MSLEQWLRNGWLQRNEPTVAQIQQLLRVVDRDVSDAQAKGLSADGKFEHAYDAALQLCLIALLASGYQVPKGAGLHKRAIDSLRYTLGDRWSDTADHVERCSRLRGQAIYERVGVVSEEDADDLLNTARQLRTDVINWLKENHPMLVPPGL
ncbi:MAG TPA: hypothetical protein VMY37_14570 [Thermoguttaceae bacterium]|nr:hypothetical protein [Thermoguttaceae bacterium]